MEALAHLVIAAIDMAEAEARSLRRHVGRLGVGLALIVVAAWVFIMALGFLSWSLMEWLASFQRPHVAAAVVGLSLLLLVGGLAWQTKRLLN
jgi:flagellar biogenesis protein FliO